MLLEIKLGRFTECLQAVCGCNSTAGVFKCLFQLSNEEIHALLSNCSSNFDKRFICSLFLCSAALLVAGSQEERWQHIVEVIMD